MSPAVSCSAAAPTDKCVRGTERCEGEAGAPHLLKPRRRRPRLGAVQGTTHAGGPDFRLIIFHPSLGAAVHHAGHVASLLAGVQRHAHRRAAGHHGQKEECCQPLRHRWLKTIRSGQDACQEISFSLELPLDRNRSTLYTVCVRDKHKQEEPAPRRRTGEAAGVSTDTLRTTSARSPPASAARGQRIPAVPARDVRESVPCADTASPSASRSRLARVPS